MLRNSLIIVSRGLCVFEQYNYYINNDCTCKLACNLPKMFES